MQHDWLYGLLGGGMIGASALVMFAGIGRVAGVSGILYTSLMASGEPRSWRIAFLLAMVTGGGLAWLAGGNMNPVAAADLGGAWLLVPAGLLVGLGTRIGNGCTSGHGVCGVSRWSTRSLVATASFMVLGLLTATLLRPLLGLSS